MSRGWSEVVVIPVVTVRWSGAVVHPVVTVGCSEVVIPVVTVRWIEAEILPVVTVGFMTSVESSVCVTQFSNHRPTTYRSR